MSENIQTVAPKLTRAEKLAARIELLTKRIATDNEALVEANTELANLSLLASIGAGSAVTIKIGRKFADKDTTRFVQGVVLGVKEDEDSGAKSYKVSYGEGFEADIAVVNSSAISLPAAVPEVAAE